MKKQVEKKQIKTENHASTAYCPWDIEPKWVEKWEQDLHQEAIDHDPRGKYYALAEFPYPSGTGLHMGHAFTFCVLDPLVRMKRRQGENVMYPMGWDAFGLPTENYALKTGIHPVEATKQNTDRYRQQMKNLGLSFNWEREINTTDPNYYRWTQWIFVQLFKHGLAYKKITPVGWCPACKIILANEEIVGGKCERCGAEAEQRMQKQWLLKITQYADRLAKDLDLVDYPEYIKTAQRNWIGRTEGVIIDYPVVTNCHAEFISASHTINNEILKQVQDDNNIINWQETDQIISCYSTRPDTNFGATFVVVAPEHEFIQQLLDRHSGEESATTPESQKVDSGQARMTLELSDQKRKEIEDYVNQAKKKSELQRTELQKEKTGVFTGLYCLNRLTNRKMPIWIADFAIATSGTGNVICVPAHDQRDFDFAKKYNLEIIPVVKPKEGDWDFEKGPFVDIDDATIINSEFINGLPAREAIEKIIDYLVKKGWGRKATNYKLRDWIFSRQHYWGEPIPMVYCEQCAKDNISWWKTEEGKQWKMENGKWKNIQTIINSQLSIINSNFQLEGWFPVSEDQLPVELPFMEKYQPSGTGQSPLAQATDWVNTTCPNCGGKAKRETDCMPNWAGSSWYFLAYPMTDKLGAKYAKRKTQNEQKPNIFSENKNLIDFWAPVDIYMGGAEHTTLHLLYSRFWHKFLFDLGLVPSVEPYTARRQHGMILGIDNEKMSKSRGNVVNPEEVSDKFGSDTLRLYLMFMGPYDQTMPWNSKGVEGSWRFLNRVWRLVTDSCHPERHACSPRWRSGEAGRPAVVSCHPERSEGSHPSTVIAGDSSHSLRMTERTRMTETDLDRKMHQTIKKVTEDITNLKHNTAIATIMDYVNAIYAYNGQWKMLRFSKPRVLDFQSGENGKKEEVNEKNSENYPLSIIHSQFINTLVLILAPFAPFMAEELWTNVLGNEFSVHQQPWPKYDPAKISEEEVEVIVQVNGKLRGAITMQNVKCKMQNEVEKEVKEDKNIQKHLTGKEIKKIIFVSGKLINFVVGE